MAEPRIVELPALDFRAEVSSVDAQGRTVEVRWTTGAAVLRRDWLSGSNYLEVLSLNPKHVRLDRLNSGAPVLNSHEADSLSRILGVVVEGSARIAGPADARAQLRFSKRADVEPYFQDVRDGIIRNVSVGYRVHKFEESRGKDGAIVRTAIDWEPYEISLVPIGADAGARLRGAGALNRCEICEPGHGTTESDAPDVVRLRRLRLAQATEVVEEREINPRFSNTPHLRYLTDAEVVSVWEQIRVEAEAAGNQDLASTMRSVLTGRDW